MTTTQTNRHTNTRKRAELIGKGTGVFYFDYDPDLFEIARIEAMLGEKHVFPTMRVEKNQIYLRGRMPLRPYTDVQDHDTRVNENKMPIEIVVYNDHGIGFVEIFTTEEFALHPMYMSLVGKLCDSRAKAELDNYAINALGPLRLTRRLTRQ